MSVRARVALSLALIVGPVIAVAFGLIYATRREAWLEALHATVIERMENGGRELCEADPDRFGLGRRVRREAPFQIARRGLRTYDATLRPTQRRGIELDRELREALESGERIAIGSRRGGEIPVAMRMPWDEGACVVLATEVRAGAVLSGARWIRDLGIAAVVLIVAMLAAFLALGPPMARLRALADAVRTSTPRSLELPARVRGGDEIGAVAAALERASRDVRDQLTQLEARDRALTAYVDGTTHDLAIPLTVMQGRLADLDARARSGQVIEPDLLQHALRECEYLGHLIANLAAAARFAGGAPRIEKADVDLREIAERVVSRHRVIARPGETQIELAVPERAVSVRADGILIERMLSNLVHNAIRHRAPTPTPTQTPGHVAVVLTARAGRFRLSVADDGTEADLDRIRAALDRTATTSSPARGRGLGLGIVRSIAAAHSLHVGATKTPEGGLEIAIEGATVDGSSQS